MASGTIRYWAAAREAAGVAEEPYEADTLRHAIEAASVRHGAGLAGVLERCSYLVDGQRRARDASLTPGAVIDVLPPFAGG